MVKRNESCSVIFVKEHTMQKSVRSLPKCFHCKSKHNSALHEDLVIEEKRGVPAPQTTVNTASDERKNVLLKTAQTYGFGADRSEKQLVNILFDSGSQRSYISEETVKKLGLKVEKTETVYLKTFGSNKYGNLQLADSYATCEKRIELNIGVDCYYRIVQGEVRKGGNGLVAISRKLGWLLCGPVVCNEGDQGSLSNVMNLIVDVLPSRDEITDDSREIVESLTKFWKNKSAGLYETENPENKKIDNGEVDINFKDGRYTPKVLTADIEKAFLQIELNEEDRDALRFLCMSEESGETPAVEQSVVTGEDDQTFSEYALGTSTSSFDNVEIRCSYWQKTECAANAAKDTRAMPPQGSAQQTQPRQRQQAPSQPLQAITRAKRKAAIIGEMQRQASMKRK
eukprot:gene16271-biopygen5528